MIDYDIFKKDFDTFFHRTLSEKILSLPKSSYELTDFFSWFTNKVSNGGKRIRPYMAFLGAQQTNRQDISGIYLLGVGIELLHLFALIHDDIIDQAETRRGQPAAHIYLEKKYTKQKNASHLGSSSGLLVGDLLLSWAYEYVGGLRFVPTIFSQSVEEMIAGQYKELHITARFPEVRREDILAVAIQKSGRYTITRPFQMGWAFSHGDVLEAFSEFGDQLGLAFQLQDDLLSTFGDVSETGKSNSADIIEGKATLLAFETVQHLPKQDTKTFLNFYGNQNSTDKDINWVRTMMEQSGARQVVEQQRDLAFEKSKKSLEGINLSDETKKSLRDFIARLKARSH